MNPRTRYRLLQPIDANRIRQRPRQFAQLDRRLVYEKHLHHMSLEQIALYVFLEAVSSPTGVSFYSDERICQCLRFCAQQLRQTRQELVQKQFLLFRAPVYQILDLPACPPQPPSCPPLAAFAQAPVQSVRPQPTRAPTVLQQANSEVPCA